MKRFAVFSWNRYSIFQFDFIRKLFIAKRHSESHNGFGRGDYFGEWSTLTCCNLLSRRKILTCIVFILRSWFNLQNGTQQTREVDDERRTNHKKRTKDCFLMFCEVVLQHERELLSEVIIPFYLFLFFTKFFAISRLAIAINRHSTHPRNQFTRLELLSRRLASSLRT